MTNPEDSISLDDLATQLGIDIHQSTTDDTNLDPVLTTAENYQISHDENFTTNIETEYQGTNNDYNHNSQFLETNNTSPFDNDQNHPLSAYQSTPCIENNDCSHLSETTNYHNESSTSNHHVVMEFHSSSSTLSTTVHFYPNGDVYWDKGGYAGYISGNTFYNSHSHKIAILGADWKIYDVHNKIIGYIDENGACHNLAGKIIADNGTVKQCAAQLIYNVASPD